MRCTAPDRPIFFSITRYDRLVGSVAGLVSELMGRIPEKGAAVEEGGLRFEVLQATKRRIEKLRVQRVTRSEDKHPDKQPA